jgi:hypothetical protein
MPKRARKEADWRTPLFFWRGALTLAAADQQSSESGGGAARSESGGGGTGGGAACCESGAARAAAELVWEGAWVSASLEEGLPADGAFESSPCTFRCSVRMLLPAGAPLSLAALAGAALTLSASTYLLDNGEGLQRFHDETHLVAFDAPPPDGSGTALLVGGQGNTEFGRFVSIGMAEAEEGGGLKLTLARRYLDSGDARLSWRGGVGALEGCTAAGAPRSELLRGPWAALPWRVAAERRAKSKSSAVEKE